MQAGRPRPSKPAPVATTVPERPRRQRRAPLRRPARGARGGTGAATRGQRVTRTVVGRPRSAHRRGQVGEQRRRPARRRRARSARWSWWRPADARRMATSGRRRGGPTCSTPTSTRSAAGPRGRRRGSRWRRAGGRSAPWATASVTITADAYSTSAIWPRHLGRERRDQRGGDEQRGGHDHRVGRSTGSRPSTRPGVEPSTATATVEPAAGGRPIASTRWPSADVAPERGRSRPPARR